MTLDGRYTRRVRDATQSWAWFCPHGSADRIYLFPLSIVEEAARNLGVNVEVLMGSEY